MTALCGPPPFVNGRSTTFAFRPRVYANERTVIAHGVFVFVSFAVSLFIDVRFRNSRRWRARLCVLKLVLAAICGHVLSVSFLPETMWTFT